MRLPHDNYMKCISLESFLQLPQENLVILLWFIMSINTFLMIDNLISHVTVQCYQSFPLASASCHFHSYSY